MRLVARAWVIGLFGLTACQLVAGITDGTSHGPCADDSECPVTESCIAGHCQSKSTGGGAGVGAQGGTGGTSGVGGVSGQTSMGGSAGLGGSSASGGGSGASQAGTAAAQGGDAGTGGVSGSGSSEGGESGSGAGDGGGGEATGTGGGGATAGTGGGGMGGAGTGGVAGDGGTGGVAGSMAGSAGLGGTAGSGGAGPIRIMSLGDGITATTCMRAFLWKALSDSAYPAFDFVGSRVSADTCSPSEYDKDNEGHSGYRVSDVLSATPQRTGPDGDPYTGSSADLDLWFTGRPADIVLMLLGSNDFLSTDHSAADVQNAYSAILAKLRSVNPRVTLLAGLLPPMSTNQCDSSCASRRTDLNSALPNWAASASTSDSRVLVVDLSTGFDVANTTDGIKPNDTGAQFLADRWYSAIDSL